MADIAILPSSALPKAGDPGLIVNGLFVPLAKPAYPTKLLLHLDDSTADSSRYAVPVTAGSGMSYVDGRFGRALQFPGNASQGVFIPDGAAVIGRGDWTIECYVKPAGTSRRALFAFERDMRLCVDLTGVVRLWASSNGSSWDILQSDGGGDDSGIGTVELTLNDWNHIAYVYIEEESRYLSFVNGVKDVDKVRPGKYLAANEALRFGRYGNDAVTPSNDAIDEIRISSRAVYRENFTPPDAPFTG